MNVSRSVRPIVLLIALLATGVARSEESDQALRVYAEAAAIVVYGNELCGKSDLPAHDDESLKAVIRPMLLRIGRKAAEAALMEGHIAAERTFGLATSDSEKRLFCTKIYEFAEKLLKPN